MAKFEFTLSPDQLKEVTKQATEKLQKTFDVDAAKAKKLYEDTLKSLQTAFEKDVEKLNTKFKKGYVESPDEKVVPAESKRHTWLEDEIDALAKMYETTAARASAISKQLNIPASAVNAKITALKKAGKLS